MKKNRLVYYWVLSLANKTYGTIAHFFNSVFESILLSTIPNAFLIPFLIGNRKKIYFFAFICCLGSILGGCVAYIICQVIWWNQSGEFSQFAFLFFQFVPGFDTENFNHIKSQRELYNFLILCKVDFTPILFKAFTLSSGAFCISSSMFVTASLISRKSWFFLLAFVVKLYVNPIVTFIDKYFSLLSNFIYHPAYKRIFILKVIF